MAVRLSKIAEEYRIAQEEAFKCIKKAGDLAGVKVMGVEGCGTVVVSGEMVEMLTVEKETAAALVVGRDLLLPSASIPLASGPCIYFLFDKKTLVYIGQSMKVVQRIGSHIGSKEFDEVVVFPVKKENITMAEQVNIRHYMPELNCSKWSDVDFLSELLKRCCLSDLREIG